MEPETIPTARHDADPCASPPENDWCAADLRILDPQTCYVVPDQLGPELLVYLHGVVPPPAHSPQATTVQHIAANAARRANIAVMIPRGIQGIGPRAREAWWSWPTGEAIYRQHARGLVDRLQEARRALEACLDHRFERVYLAGSSAGAYFISLLAVHGQMPVDAYGAMSGGSGYSISTLSDLAPKPVYVGYGTADSVGPGAQSLVQLLRRNHWPVKVSTHPFGHGAREVYLDEAIAFWRLSLGMAIGPSRPSSVP